MIDNRASDRSTLRRPRLAAAAVTVLLLVLGGLVAAAPAQASPAPMGSMDSLTVPSVSTVRVAGWTALPTSGHPLAFAIVVDGRDAVQGTAAQPRPDLAHHYPAIGANHGFVVSFHQTEGIHTVCLAASFGGVRHTIACRSLTLLYSPIGAVEHAAQTSSGLTVSGWMADPDTTASITGYLTVDGVRSVDVDADQPRADIARAHPGQHGFVASIPQVAAGQHTVCAYGNNVGPGHTQRVGCLGVAVNWNPSAFLDSVTQVPDGAQVRGWTFDRNSSAPLQVTVSVDGATVGKAVANTSRPDVQRFYGRPSAALGYLVTVPVATTGTHTICVVSLNVGAGSNTQICRSSSLNFDPRGAIESAVQTPGGVTLSGWTVDPDSTGAVRPSVLVDGVRVAMTTASLARPDLVAQHVLSTPDHGFKITVSAGQGTHTVCLRGGNLGSGSADSAITCRTVALDFRPRLGVDRAVRLGNSDVAQVSGWAADPDTSAPISVSVRAGSLTPKTVLANVGHAATTGASADHGFITRLAIPTGETTVCVTALNVGQGSNSDASCSELIAANAAAPRSPGAVRVTPGYASAVVTWTPPASDGGAPVTAYRVWQSGHAFVQVAAAARSWTFTGLQPGHPYRFYVMALNQIGAGAAATAVGTVLKGVPPQTTTPGTSVSRYIRGITSVSGSVSWMRAAGASDAARNASNHQYAMLLDIGGQTTQGAAKGVVLSAGTGFVSYSSLVSLVNAYVDGYASRARGNAPAAILIGANNDMTVNASTGADWATLVVNPVAAHAASYPAITVMGADDIEPGFRAGVAATRLWEQGYLGATGARLVFNGSADGCSWSRANAACNNGWTMRDLAWFAGGAAPGRVLALPQVYNTTMAEQWKYISLTSVANGGRPLNFLGSLTEVTACAQAGDSCYSMGSSAAWNALWSQLRSDSRVAPGGLPSTTDLRIN